MVIAQKTPRFWTVLFLSIIFSLCFLIAVQAEEGTFKVTSKVINNRIAPEEWAEFEITIRNSFPYYEVFRVINPQEGIEWSMLTDPKLFIDGVLVKGKDEKTFKVLLKDIELPRDYKKPYNILLVIKGKESKYAKTLKFPIYLMPGEYSDEPDFDVITNFPKTVDPQQIQSFKLTVKNNNWKDYSQIKVHVEGDIFSRESVITLIANDTKTIDFPIQFPTDISQAFDTITITLSHPTTGEQYHKSEASYRVKADTIPFQQKMESETSWFLRTDTIKVTNQQNIPSEQEINIPTSLLEAFIGSSDPEMQRLKTTEGRFYTTRLRLDARETYTITLTTNYRLLIYAVIALAVLLFIYYLFKAPIVVIKQATQVKITHDGLQSVTVMLTVINRSGKEYPSVQLYDKVPKLLRLSHTVDQTFRPIKTIRHETGDVISWKFDLTPKEERIISYMLTPKLNIVGDVRLPKALVKFHEGGHVIKSHSNELDVSSSKLYTKKEAAELEEQARLDEFQK